MTENEIYEMTDNIVDEIDLPVCVQYYPEKGRIIIDYWDYSFDPDDFESGREALQEAWDDFKKTISVLRENLEIHTSFDKNEPPEIENLGWSLCINV